MEKSLRELLLKDLCSRLPYGVKVTWDGIHHLTVTPHVYCSIASVSNLPKLLLRPMSSMTKEEEDEWWEFENKNIITESHSYSVDWLNAHHFDYRGLIEKGLALEALEGMYN